jgi:hypothetical protein
MEFLAILIIWPFLILAFGLVFITFEDVAFGGFWLIFFGLIIIAALMTRERNKLKGQVTSYQELQTLRELVLIMSISLLIPIFLRYLFETFEHTLAVTILGLIIGFGLAIWGMFIKSNRVLMYSNIIGGALSIAYVYVQLWELGELARIIAAAFGLIVAITISIIKLKDKLA